MELGYLLVVAVSAAAGFVLRSVFSRALSRLIRLVGLAALVLGGGIVAVTVLGWSPFAPITGGLVAAVLLAVGAVAFPLGLMASWTRH
jgi:hypothetical protein